MKVPAILNFLFLIVSALIFFLSCDQGTPPPATLPVDSAVVKETPKDTPALARDTGFASFYGSAFEGKKTASGEIFHSAEMVAAHPKYPLGTKAIVTNLENGDTVHIRINDRGPTKVNRREGVIIDLSKGAAKKIRMVGDGRVKVEVRVTEWGKE